MNYNGCLVNSNSDCLHSHNHFKQGLSAIKGLQYAYLRLLEVVSERVAFVKVSQRVSFVAREECFPYFELIPQKTFTIWGIR